MSLNVLTTLLIPALAAAPPGPAANGVAGNAAQAVDIQIQVRDIPGDPLAAVQLLLEGRGETLRAETTSTGLAAFTGVPPGRYRLRAEKEGYRAHVQDLEVAGRAPRPVQIRLVKLHAAPAPKP
jgi:hypothetical protein